MDSYLFSWTAIDNEGNKAMEEVIVVANIDKVNVHYKDPNKHKSKPQLPGGRKIYYDLDTAVAEDLK
ncbi:MAG TPA: hypothetical protein VFI73_06335 [Candidatus Nitrosopolaris sp.]|nr:hypothetical protein [Candidatus Nitrosopolaris sp.]